MSRIVLIICLFFSFTSFAKSSSDTHLIDEMLTTVQNKYIENINLNEIVLTGLNAFNDLDHNIVVSKGNDKIYLYYNKQIKKIIPIPKDNNDLSGWIEATIKAIDYATEISDAISMRDFEIPDLMMKKITKSLDKYSAYYSEYDYYDTEQENSIYTLFSSRKIDDYLYLRMRIFNKQSANQVTTAINQNPKIKGIILDLRGNSGGMFNEALKIANLFTSSEIITYTAGRDKDNIHYYTSEEDVLYDGPLVIIVDGDTASAAEVLAAGMQDQTRAKIVGTKTFGKGTIQSIIKMSNGGRLVLTTEQFFTPSGKEIHNIGVVPDVCTSLDNNGLCRQESRLREEKDLEEAINLIKNEF